LLASALNEQGGGLRFGSDGAGFLTLAPSSRAVLAFWAAAKLF